MWYAPFALPQMGACLWVEILGQNDFEGISGEYKGSTDGFLTYFSIAGDQIWGEYLGGVGYDFIHALFSLPNVNVLIGGRTESNDFYGLSGSHKGSADGFLLKHIFLPTSRPAPQAPLPLSLAPNPAADQARVILNLDAGGPATLEAYDTAGRLVHSRRFDLQAGDNRLDLSYWPAGVYSVHLKTEGKEYAGRLVKN